MDKLIWTTVQRAISVLVPQEVNPRKINDKQMSDLKKSLQKFNLVEIPVIDLDGKILAGHQRLKAMQLLGRGEELIDVRIPNRKLTDDEAKRYLVASNALGGDWDFDLLKSFDLDMLADVGFDPIDMSKVWGNVTDTKNDDFDEKKELLEVKQVNTKLGDIIVLGNHKIICGDSTDPETLKKLFAEDRASMIYSDPIYNIGLDYNKGVGGNANYGGTVTDSKSYLEYRDFISKSLMAALTVTYNNAHVFYWCDQIYIGLIQGVYNQLNVHNKRVCMWIKNGANPTPGVAFSKCYEPCVYGVRGKPKLTEGINDLNEVMNKDMTTGNSLLEEISDLWGMRRLAGKDYEHSTSKPPELHHKAILRCTKQGDIILDSFLGSGSTLIAGEQLKRRVYGCEIEPVFCDLIIRRFEKLTGIKAQVIRS